VTDPGFTALRTIPGIGQHLHLAARHSDSCERRSQGRFGVTTYCQKFLITAKIFYAKLMMSLLLARF